MSLECLWVQIFVASADAGNDYNFVFLSFLQRETTVYFPGQ